VLSSEIRNEQQNATSVMKVCLAQVKNSVRRGTEASGQISKVLKLMKNYLVL
jgi:hypothetical protein